MIRRARATWHGTGRAGSGSLSSDSGVLSDAPYSCRTRFENEKGTNPEELIAVTPVALPWRWSSVVRSRISRLQSSLLRPPLRSIKTGRHFALAARR
jgi:hypothetical protein